MRSTLAVPFDVRLRKCALHVQASGSYADEWAEVEKTRTPSPAPVPVVNAWAKPLISAPAARRPPPGMSQPGTEPSSAAGLSSYAAAFPHASGSPSLYSKPPQTTVSVLP